MNRNMYFILYSLLFFTQLKGYAQPNEKTMAEIIKSNQSYFEAFRREDSSLLIDHYATECWIMPSEGATYCGPDAVTDFFKKSYNQGVRNGRFITNEVYGNDENFITEEGFYQFLDDKNKVLENGIFLTLWKNTSKGWKMYRTSFHNHSSK